MKLMRTGILTGILAGLLAMTSVVASPDPSPVHAVAPTPPAGATVYRPISPARFADTRQTGPAAGVWSTLDAATIRVPVTGSNGVPANAVAVMATITYVRPTATGYITVYPSGQPRSTTSVVNAPAGKTASNTLPFILGAGGSIDLYRSQPGGLIVDVVGYMVADTSSVTGRWKPLYRPVAVGQMVSPVSPLAVGAGMYNVGSSDAMAVAVEVTVTGPVPAGGYMAAGAGDAAQPATSFANFSGEERSYFTLVPVGGGDIKIWSTADAYLTVAIVGVLSGPSGWAGMTAADGWIIPRAPQRLADSRLPGSPVQGSAADYGATVAVQVPSVPSGAAVLFANVTTTASAGGVFADAWSPGDGSTVKVVPTWHPSWAYAVAYPMSINAAGVGTASSQQDGGHVIIDAFATVTWSAATWAASQPNGPAMVFNRWALAVRHGGTCEAKVLATLNTYMPAGYKWLIPYIEIVHAASFTHPSGLTASAVFEHNDMGVNSSGAGDVWFEYGVPIPVMAPMTMLIKDTACSGSRSTYIAVHEAIGHMSDAMPSLAVGNTDWLSDQMPVFEMVDDTCDGSGSLAATSHLCLPVEMYADCVIRVLGASGGATPYYSRCNSAAMQAATWRALSIDVLHPNLVANSCTVAGVYPQPVAASAVWPTAAGFETTTFPAGSVHRYCAVDLQLAGGESVAGDYESVVSAPDGRMWWQAPDGVVRSAS